LVTRPIQGTRNLDQLPGGFLLQLPGTGAEAAVQRDLSCASRQEASGV